MTKEQIQAYIDTNIKGQGNQLDIGSKLGDVLSSIIEMIQEVETPLMVQSESNTTISGFSVPSLTAEQVEQAYNAVVTGRGCIIVDKDELMHAYANQADQLNDELSIGILYYSSLVLTYTLSGDSVTITAVEL